MNATPTSGKPLSAFLLASVLLIALLPGCVTPHRFTAYLRIMENGDYVFAYNGTYYDHDVMTLIDANPNRDPEKDPMLAEMIEEKVDRMIQVLSINPRIVSYEYVGKGLFNVSYLQHGNVNDEPMRLLGEFAELFVLEKKAGSLVFRFSPEVAVSAQMRRLSLSLAGNMDGRIEIHSDLPVARHSGGPESAPDLPGRLVWRLSGWNPAAEKPAAVFSGK